MAKKHGLHLASVRANLTVAEAAAFLINEGVPMDHYGRYGGRVRCAYCGISVDELLDAGCHHETCAWSALRNALRRQEKEGHDED